MPVPPPPEAKKVFEGILATVYQWPQVLFDGSTKTFEVYVRHDTTAVIPFLDKDTILMTYQEQPGRPPFWDAPGGRVEPGENIEAAALRELHEETGYRPGAYELFASRAHHGLTRFEEAIYIAKDLKLDPNGNNEDAGEKIRLVPMSFKEAVERCLRGEIRRDEVALAIIGMHYDPTQRAKLEAFLA
jgi:ADP-ribose pyrophosphatase